MGINQDDERYLETVANKTKSHADTLNTITCKRETLYFANWSSEETKQIPAVPSQ